ncbi:hypothetical protein CVT24_011175 [Panaeolus cyanescens]|uniref:Uncharacterized protein n=1 Tax=Panaeolus cyanescens TaxID=181874 RepID=A0A409YGC7_9AGAR|nr:hypothetical protein CVT24_011175 [Panaeolus cyanescens]
MEHSMDDTPIPDDDGLIDCDCGCNKRVTPATWRSHRAGGGSLTLQILRAAACSSGNEQDVQMSPSDDDPHLELFMSQLDDIGGDELARDDIDIGESKRPRSATDADHTLSKRPRPSTPTSAETPRSPLGQPISDTFPPFGSPESSAPHHRYQTRLASSRLSRWPVQPARTAKKSGAKPFIADHPSEDEADKDDDDDDAYDDMPDLLDVSNDEEDGEDDDEGDKGEEEEEDEEEDDDDQEDDNQKAAAIQTVFEDMQEEQEEQEEEEEEQEAGEDNDELEEEIERFAALALEARQEAAQAAARRVHEAQTDVLDEDDLDVLRTFVLKTEDHLTERTFKRLSRAYPKQEHLSLKMTRKRAATLSGFQAVKYDCSVSSKGPRVEVALTTSFAQYVQLVDKNARRHGTDPDFDEKEFYGQLKRILVIKLPKAPEINIHKRRTVIFALVQTIVTEEVGGFHCFKRMGRNDIVDLATMHKHQVHRLITALLSLVLTPQKMGLELDVVLKSLAIVYILLNIEDAIRRRFAARNRRQSDVENPDKVTHDAHQRVVEIGMGEGDSGDAEIIRERDGGELRARGMDSGERRVGEVVGGDGRADAVNERIGYVATIAGCIGSLANLVREDNPV